MHAADAAGRRVPRHERTAFRNAHLRPLMDEFFTWAAAARDRTPGRNLATRALGYALNQETEPSRVLLDGSTATSRSTTRAPSAPSARSSSVPRRTCSTPRCSGSSTCGRSTCRCGRASPGRRTGSSTPASRWA
ncbi:MAG: transposase [Actinobacteria bacterium]|nr:transposase [Actinomycetota bacterium]